MPLALTAGVIHRDLLAQPSRRSGVSAKGRAMSDGVFAQGCGNLASNRPKADRTDLTSSSAERVRPNLNSPYRNGFDLEGLARFLRRKHRWTPAWCVAKATGIPEKTIRNWLELRAAPSAANLLQLARHYGAGLIEAAYRDPPAEILHAARYLHARALEAEIAAKTAELDALRREGER